MNQNSILSLLSFEIENLSAQMHKIFWHIEKRAKNQFKDLKVFLFVLTQLKPKKFHKEFIPKISLMVFAKFYNLRLIYKRKNLSLFQDFRGNFNEPFYYFGFVSSILKLFKGVQI